MPAITTKFLAAVNGTTFDENLNVAKTSVAAGGRNLGVRIIDEYFSTDDVAPYRLFSANAHAVLSAPGAVPAPSGNGVIVPSGALAGTYAVTVDGDGYVQVQQTSP